MIFVLWNILIFFIDDTNHLIRMTNTNPLYSFMNRNKICILKWKGDVHKLKQVIYILYVCDQWWYIARKSDVIFVIITFMAYLHSKLINDSLTNVVLEIAEIFLEADTYRRKSHFAVVSRGLVDRIKLMKGVIFSSLYFLSILFCRILEIFGFILITTLV